MTRHKPLSRNSFADTWGISKRLLTYFCSLAVLVFLCGADLAAQTTSTIEGIVKDKQGLAVAGAQVHVTSAAFAVERTVTTESDGSYRVTTLPPGVYEIKATKEGFESEVLKNLEVTLNRTLSLDITMQVGSLNQTVEVDSATPLLETTSSSTGSTITPQQIEEMPINGRNYLDLLQLVPGVALNRQNDPAGGQFDSHTRRTRGQCALFNRRPAEPGQFQWRPISAIQPGFDS